MHGVDVLGLAVVGTALSILTQLIKNQWYTNKTTTRLTVIGLSLVAGTGYYFVWDVSWWPTILSILGVVNSVYLFILKPVEDSLS